MSKEVELFNAPAPGTVAGAFADSIFLFVALSSAPPLLKLGNERSSELRIAPYKVGVTQGWLEEGGGWLGRTVTQ